MLKQVTRSFLAAVALLFLFTATSALGAQDLRPAAARAGVHRASHQRNVRRRAHHKWGAAVHRAKSLGVDVGSTTALLGDRAL
jgi:hypothetical protein